MRISTLMRGSGLELVLILVSAVLVGQLAWPAVDRWRSRPRPGAIGIETFSPGDTMAERYLLYLPERFSNADEKWPLVIFLHGSGQRGHDPVELFRHGPLIEVQDGSALPAIIALPQCLPGGTWQPDSVAEFVRHVASVYPVDESRIYLVGYSMGASGAWLAAQTYPELFAAIVPIAGGGDSSRAAALVEVPIWAFHGMRDNVVPLEASWQIVDAVRAAGGEPRITIIPDGDHGICGEICDRKDLWEWLLQQNRRRSRSARDTRVPRPNSEP